jgi:pimeloyl-ACP methyl ester carboxylesterase
MKPLIRRLAWMALLCLAANAGASIRPVHEGEAPTLRPDEGLLLVDVDTTTPINAVRIVQPGSDWGKQTISDLPKGKTSRLFVATAGTYHWSRLERASGWSYYDLHDKPDFQFEVLPGVINYPGDLVFRPGVRTYLHAPNRGLVGIDWLRAHAPEVYARYSFVYSGHYPDPFPEFYKTARAEHPERGDADLEHTLSPPAPSALPIPIEELFRHSHIRSLSMNPRGDLVAETTFENKAWHVDVIDLKTERATRVLDLDYDVTKLQWISDQILAVTAGTVVPVVRIIRIGESGPRGREHSGFAIPQPGRVLVAIPGKPGHVLFQRGSSLFDIDISDADAFKHERSAFSAQIDRGLHGVVQWFVDGAARPRAAIVADRDGLALYWGADDSFRKVMRIDEANPVLPLGVSADGSRIYALTDKDRGQRDLVEVDPATGAIARTAFSKPGRDVENTASDSHGNLVGALYFEDGQFAAEYFDQDNRTVSERIAKAFPGKNVLIADRDDAGAHFIVYVAGSDRPAQFYHLDSARGTAELIDEAAPWLSDRRLGTSQVVHAKGSDGVPIEAYLTVPVNTKGRPPLIVYAHGGPIGIRDNLMYDPSVQLFASLGYAVLQVNFRGSEGYGKSFREAGEHHYGSLIEDDIDAATRAALAQFPLDEQRMCAVGASYGGFSALVSAIRWPGRFRCVVSIAGISDQLLFFTASDAGWYEAGRKALEKALGDPHKDADRMRAYSPVYRYKELAAPVMLVHGTEDVRIDYEHSRRLVRMLNLAGHEPVLLTLEGAGHGDLSEQDESRMWTAIAGFLQAYLDEKPPK